MTEKFQTENVVEKFKECPSCGLIQDCDSTVFRCSSCSCIRSSKGVRNYWKLTKRFRNREKVEELKEKFGLDTADDFSGKISRIKRAVDNFYSNDTTERCSK